MTRTPHSNRKEPLAARCKRLWVRADDFLNRSIWQGSALHDTSVRGKAYFVLRIFAIIWSGLRDNNLLLRAAALSFYSLIGMGPLIALVVMISGFAMDKDREALVLEKLSSLVTFVAPSVGELERLERELSPPPDGETPDNDEAPPENEADEVAPSADAPAGGEPPTTTAPLATTADAPGSPPGDAANAPLRINEDLVKLLSGIIENSRSSAVGFVGISLIIIVGIQLLISVEESFNEIWGVRQGRSWALRTAYYWSFISLGAVLGFASVTAQMASIVASFFNMLPFGLQATWAIYVASKTIPFFTVMLVILMFYRVFPNTTVNWRAASTGAFVVTMLLFLNNLLSFLYVHRVISSKSLYGSLGIFPVLMIGLYVFWFFLLIGCQITYSVQNANYLTNQKAWKNVSMRTREMLCLAALLLICRRFRQMGQPYTVTELGEVIRAPSHILNECLAELCDLNWISASASPDTEDADAIRYLPARPLERVNLAEFKRDLECYGNDEGAQLVNDVDPLIAYYQKEINLLDDTALGKKPFSQLLEEFSEATGSVEQRPVTA